MTPSTQCLEIIEQCEGLRLAPYLCPAGVPTIGYGNTRHEDGTPVKLTDAPITQQRAEALLRFSLGSFVDAVNRYVQVPLAQGQFDALVSFAYNLGPQALRTSTLLRRLNAGDYAGAADQFDVWVMIGGKKSNGLVIRRAMEKKLFLSNRVPATATPHPQS